MALHREPAKTLLQIFQKALKEIRRILKSEPEYPSFPSEEELKERYGYLDREGIDRIANWADPSL